MEMEQGSDVLMTAGAEADSDAAGMLSTVDKPTNVLMPETDVFVVEPALSSKVVAT